jgi:hypothetical protein
MEGGGIFTALGLLLLAPFQLLQGAGEPTPHELHLRRATRPLGVLALTACGVWFFGAGKVGDALGPVLLHLSQNPLLAAPLALVPLYGLVCFVAGARQCWGLRSDGMLPFWAFVEFAAGAGGLWFLWFAPVDLARALHQVMREQPALWLALNGAAIWCAVVGGARLLLLTVGGGNAFAQAARWSAQTQIQIRPVRLGPWWWPF